MNPRLFRRAVAALGLMLSLPCSASIVADWNAAALAEVRVSKLGPPITARALAVAHTCMYDAWSVYDSTAVPTVAGTPRRPVAERTDANKAKAVSYAAYRCLLNLYPSGAARLTAVLAGQGYDPSDTGADLATPQGGGNVAAGRVIAARRNDGSNQYADLKPSSPPYADYTGYAPTNAPLPFCTPQTVGACPPLSIADPLGWQPLVSNTGATQTFIAPFWERVQPFALSSATQFDSLIPQPDIFAAGFSRYQANVEELLQYSAQLDLSRKLVVEYWADGPNSELPPGHWGLFAQYLSSSRGYTIDQDVKMFFAMHNASFDAGIAAWHVKRQYNGVRPITAVRYLKQGSSVLAWGGPGRPTESVRGEKWLPYNPGSNFTPAFPGYISGHSTFSSASAAVLQQFTGSDAFGFTTVIPANFGRVEPGVPPVPTALSYPTFSSAAVEAGQSRLYGGVHFADDNTIGQQVGRLVGLQAWSKAQTYFDGTAAGIVNDASSAAVFDKAALISWAHTVGAGSNRLLVVGVTYRDGNQGVASVTFRGAAMTRVATQNAPGNQNRAELWMVLAPAVGPGTVNVTLSNARSVVAGATSLRGVRQDAPVLGMVAAAGQTQNPSIGLASETGNVIFSLIAANGDALFTTPTSGAAFGWNTGDGTAGGDIRGAGLLQAGAATAQVTYAMGRSKPWAMLALSLRPALAAP